jgi:hypothetical protein
MTEVARRQIIAIAEILLDHRRLSAGEQSFLVSIAQQAKAAPAGFAMTARQEAFWDTILDSHEGALIEIGLVEDWRKA